MLYLVGTGAQHSRPGKMVGESGPEPSIKDRAGPLVDVWFWSMVNFRGEYSHKGEIRGT